jgi:hypothetical protein
VDGVDFKRRGRGETGHMFRNNAAGLGGDFREWLTTTGINGADDISYFEQHCTILWVEFYIRRILKNDLI